MASTHVSNLMRLGHACNVNALGAAASLMVTLSFAMICMAPAGAVFHGVYVVLKASAIILIYADSGRMHAMSIPCSFCSSGYAVLQQCRLSYAGLKKQSCSCSWLAEIQYNVQSLRLHDEEANNRFSFHRKAS